MPSVTTIKAGSLGELNFAANAAIGFLYPLSAQVDAFLAATLGPLTADLTAQLNASLAAVAQIGIGISNPLLSLQLAVQAVAQLQTALQAALAFPTINVTAEASLSAAASLAAALEVKLGLLNAAVKALLAIKLPIAGFMGDLAGNLSAGPAFLVELDIGASGTLEQLGADIAAQFATGLTYGPYDIFPTDVDIKGYMFVTKAPGVKGGLDFMLQGI